MYVHSMFMLYMFSLNAHCSLIPGDNSSLCLWPCMSAHVSHISLLSLFFYHKFYWPCHSQVAYINCCITHDPSVTYHRGWSQVIYVFNGHLVTVRKRKCVNKGTVFSLSSSFLPHTSCAWLSLMIWYFHLHSFKKSLCSSIYSIVYVHYNNTS